MLLLLRHLGHPEHDHRRGRRLMFASWVVEASGLAWVRMLLSTGGYHLARHGTFTMGGQLGDVQNEKEQRKERQRKTLPPQDQEPRACSKGGDLTIGRRHNQLFILTCL
ncbi:hypothetical protein LX32DRAFT_438068 [Colletotrichum zoysiae]|uniref:Uncharacterized protein n=1 Tax=Colletotrichum zoysiae TaxID=1216348 RepID=A0AAD9HGD0_9PEZI|nr:hypothetical protein LX32DRAFT_438068 [Colletotrichum zoysiae]